MAVSGRGTLSADPSLVAVGRRSVRFAPPGHGVGGALAHRGAMVGSADPRRRRARFQLVTEDGQAHLVVLAEGRWWLAATYD